MGAPGLTDPKPDGGRGSAGTARTPITAAEGLLAIELVLVASGDHLDRVIRRAGASPSTRVLAVVDTAPVAGPPGCAGVPAFGWACAHAMPTAKSVETKSVKLSVRRCMANLPYWVSVDEFATGLTLLRYTKLRDGVDAVLDMRPFVALRRFRTAFPYRCSCPRTH